MGSLASRRDALRGDAGGVAVLMDEDEDDFQDDDSDLIDDRLECPRCGLTDDLCECES